MSKANNGGPAFPAGIPASEGYHPQYWQEGVSVRDYIAIKMISGAGITLQAYPDGEFIGIPNKKIMVEKAYEMADAIIEYGEIGK